MGDVLAGLAQAASSSHARESNWFDELIRGSGRAAMLGVDVRHALIAVTADIAREQARMSRLDADRRATEQRRESAEARRRYQQEQWRRNRAIVGEAFRLLWLRALGSAILVLFTPAVASFVILIPLLDNIKPVVFFPGETGSYAGSGPLTLYSILMWCVGSCLAALFFSDIAFGAPDERWAFRFSTPGALLGLGMFCLQWYNGGLAWYSWTFAPILFTVGYIAECAISGSRIRLLRDADRHRESQ